MTFDSLVQRCIMEKSWAIPTKDSPEYDKVQREMDDYEKEMRNLFRTLPSGAKFWGTLALTPEKETKDVFDPVRITREQAIDYGLPPKEYKFIGSGAESVVYGDDRYVYKIPRTRGLSRSHLGSSEVSIDDPESQLVWRMRKCSEAKKVNDLPPLELADVGPDKFFLHYSKYKDIKASGEVHPFDSKQGVSYDAESGKVIMPDGVQYNAEERKFTVVNTYTFNSLNMRCMDNGILIQDTLPQDATDLTSREKISLTKHMEKNGVYVDKRNIGSNIKKGISEIYVMD